MRRGGQVVQRGYCQVCGGFYMIRKDGKVRTHGYCRGAGLDPMPAIGRARLGPRAS